MPEPSPDSLIPYVTAALRYHGRRSATIQELEALHGASYAPQSPLGAALLLGIEQGHFRRDGDRVALADAPTRPISLVPIAVLEAVADIVRDSAAPLVDLDPALTDKLTHELQRYTEALLATALDAYKPVVDQAGNYLWLHLECAWPQWGDGNQPPHDCRRCAVSTGAWTAAYSRSNVDVQRNRQPHLTAEPALVAALRGAFGDAELNALSEDVNCGDTPAMIRLRQAIDDAAGGQ
ncbi:hypothetical protein KBX50_08460 [Micromonospora sp. C51]|uniref:hypothetical protein n=1 Tax=Micromonospora sp. C51 TaxID=2824879 RepID=UPI001B37222A|nr:hypothetical protein [Micromonospora sp. C51]MBQ1048495.1 hypothetical protein [Micromonospora sp. C51]